MTIAEDFAHHDDVLSLVRHLDGTHHLTAADAADVVDALAAWTGITTSSARPYDAGTVRAACHALAAAGWELGTCTGCGEAACPGDCALTPALRVVEGGGT